MTMTHAQARQAAALAQDELLTEPERQALQQHLHSCAECAQYAAQLAQASARLASALPARYPETPLDRERMAELLDLGQQTVRRTAMPRFSVLRPLAWGLLALALIVILNWSIQSLRISPASQPGTTGQPGTSGQPTASPASELATPTIIPTPQSTPAIAAPSTSAAALPADALVPGPNFRLQAALPSAPERVMVYQQRLPGPATAEDALQLANRLGIPGGQLVMDNMVVGTDQSWLALNGLKDSAQYGARPLGGLSAGGAATLPPEQRISAAQAFVQRSGLLSDPLRLIPVPYDDRLVRILPLLDGLPVYSQVGDPHWDWAGVQVDASGVQVSSLNGFQAEPVGEYPILSAEQAWQRLLDSPTWQKSRFAVTDPQANGSPLSWKPEFPEGQTIELYGYLHHWQTRPGQAERHWITFSDMAVVEDPDPALFNLQQDATVRLWGQFSAGQDGFKTLRIERWEASDLLYMQYVGRLVRIDGSSYLQSDQERIRLIPNVSDHISDGELLDLSGYRMKDETLIWLRLETGLRSTNYVSTLSCFGEAPRGGIIGPRSSFGGGQLASPSLPELAALPEQPFLARYAPGARLEAQAGQLSVTIFRRPDGDHTQLALHVESSTNQPGGLIWLEGAVDGLEALNAQPVLVWGQVAGLRDGWPILQVERFDLQYPGVPLQRFVGRRSAGMIIGRMTVQLTTEDGQRLWLRSGYDRWENAMLDEILATGQDTLVEVEGFLIPDRLEGGSPVLYDLAIETPPDPVTTAFQPLVIDQTGAAPQITFTQVELAYLTAARQDCTAASSTDPQQAAYLLVQPIWIFTGVLPDSRTIEVQVQALQDSYLR